jgi:hypothetical protein
MNLGNFEDAVTAGKAHWITSFTYDAVAGRLVVGLTHDPECSQTERVLEFDEVANISHRWTDRDDECMEGLLGAHEEESGPIIRYTLVTDQREIEVRATTRGSIYDV